MSLYEDIKTGIKQAIAYEKNNKPSMTVKKLKEILSAFSDDMEVMVSCDGCMREIFKVGVTVDTDINVNIVDIVAEDKPLTIR